MLRFRLGRRVFLSQMPWVILAATLFTRGAAAQATAVAPRTHSSAVGTGRASSSVNAVIFRTSSAVTHGHLQYTTYCDDSARVVLTRRFVGSGRWTVHTTAYTNDVTDARE